MNPLSVSPSTQSDDTGLPPQSLEPQSLDTASPAPVPVRPAATKKHKKPPRQPLHITARKPDGLLMYARRIPKDVLALGLYPPKKETIRVGLGTREWLQAQPKAIQLTAALERMWAQARARQVPPTGPATCFDARRLRHDDVPVLGKRLEALLLHCDDVDRGRALNDSEVDRYLDEFEEQQKTLRRAGVRADTSSVEEEAIGFLQAEGLECDPGSEVWPVWLKAVLQAHLNALSAIATRLDCRPAPTPEPPPSIRGEHDLDDIDRALTYWQEKVAPEPKTVVEMSSVVGRFKETTGRTRISAIRPDDIVHFLKVERLRESARGGAVNVQTVNKGIALLKAMFSVVHSDSLKQYGISNPLADARKFKVRARDKARRRVFTGEQLDSLFSGPVHTQGERPLGGAGEAAYWIPILGYTTGARMQELLQARVEDVVAVDGVLMLRTETCPDDDDETDETAEKPPRMSLKTSESYRFIPVHQDALALGFAEYVEWVRAAGHTQLFPDVRIGVNDSWSANFSKFFNRYLRRLGIKKRMLDFVSFRHLFKTQTRALSFEQDIADYIQGHAQKRASQGYGEFPAAVLHVNICSMAFPALQHCRKWSPPPRRSLRRPTAAAAPHRG